MAGHSELIDFETERIVHGTQHRAVPPPSYAYPSQYQTQTKPQRPPYYQQQYQQQQAVYRSNPYEVDRSIDFDYRQLTYVAVESSRKQQQLQMQQHHQYQHHHQQQQQQQQQQYNTVEYVAQNMPSLQLPVVESSNVNTTTGNSSNSKATKGKTQSKKTSTTSTTTSSTTLYDKKHHAPLLQNIILNVGHCKYSIFPHVAALLGWKVSKAKDLFTESTFSSLSHPPGSNNNSNTSSSRSNRRTHTWDVLWIDSGQGIEKIIRAMKSYQRINHIPGMVYIYRKDLLGKTMLIMKQLMKYEYQFTPQTWFLPQDYQDIVQYLRTSHGSGKQQSSPCVILKPSSGAQGRGISLAMTVEQLQDVVHQTQQENYIVQSYVRNPLLLDGYKFDMRIYVLVISCDPLRILLYRNGLCRLCTVPYVAPSKHSQNTIHNVYMHLTNYSINKHNVDFVQNNYEGNSGEGNSQEQQQQDSGEDADGNNEYSSKRSIAWLQTHLEAQGIHFEPIWRQVAHVIVKTILSAQPILSSSFHNCKLDGQNKNPFTCFELLGFDVLLTSTYQPVLLEVNHMPSFSTDSTLDLDIKAALIKSALSLLNVTSYERQAYFNDQAIASQVRLYGDAFESKQREQHHKDISGKSKRKQYRNSAEYWKHYLHHEKKVIGHDRTYQALHSTAKNNQQYNREEALQNKSFDMFDLVYPANVYPYQLTSTYHNVYEEIVRRLAVLQEEQQSDDESVSPSTKANAATYKLPRANSATSTTLSDNMLEPSSGSQTSNNKKPASSSPKPKPPPAASNKVTAVDPEVRNSVVEMKKMSDNIISSLESLEQVTHQLKTITMRQNQVPTDSSTFAKPHIIPSMLSSPPPSTSKKGNSSSFRSPHRVLSVSSQSDGLFTSTLDEIESTLQKSGSDCESHDREFGDDHSDAHTDDFRTHYIDDMGDGEEEDDGLHTLPINVDSHRWSPQEERAGNVQLPNYYININHMKFDDRRSEGSDTSRSSGSMGEEMFPNDIELPALPPKMLRVEGIALGEEAASLGLSHLQMTRMENLRRIAHNDGIRQSPQMIHPEKYQMNGYSFVHQSPPQSRDFHDGSYHSLSTHSYHQPPGDTSTNHGIYNFQPIPLQLNRTSPTDNFHAQYDAYRQQYLQSYRIAKGGAPY